MENVSNAGNSSDEATSSYRRSGVLSKSRSESGLHGLLAEAPPGQVAGRPGPEAAPVDQGPHTLGFGFQAREGLLDERLLEPLGQQALPDRLVALAPLRERPRPVARDAPVVDEPGALERGERLRGRNGPYRRAVEALGQTTP